MCAALGYLEQAKTLLDVLLDNSAAAAGDARLTTEKARVFEWLAVVARDRGDKVIIHNARIDNVGNAQSCMVF